MSQASSAVSPVAVLLQLRQLAPQFAEMDQRGQYAQQGVLAMSIAYSSDADEAWTVLMSALRAALPRETSNGSIVDELFSIELIKTLSSPEAPAEAPSTMRETVLKLDCNISIQTNFLMTGILDVRHRMGCLLHFADARRALTSRWRSIVPLSTELSFIIPQLVFHDCRRTSQSILFASTGGAIFSGSYAAFLTIRKKAKIMRKVKYPLELDAMDLASLRRRSLTADHC